MSSHKLFCCCAPPPPKAFAEIKNNLFPLECGTWVQQNVNLLWKSFILTGCSFIVAMNQTCVNLIVSLPKTVNLTKINLLFVRISSHPQIAFLLPWQLQENVFLNTILCKQGFEGLLQTVCAGKKLNKTKVNLKVLFNLHLSWHFCFSFLEKKKPKTIFLKNKLTPPPPGTLLLKYPLCTLPLWVWLMFWEISNLSVN